MEVKQIATFTASICAVGIVFGGGYYVLFHNKEDQGLKPVEGDNTNASITPKADDPDDKSQASKAEEGESKNTEDNKTEEQKDNKPSESSSEKASQKQDDATKLLTNADAVFNTIEETLNTDNASTLSASDEASQHARIYGEEVNGNDSVEGSLKTVSSEPLEVVKDSDASGDKLQSASVQSDPKNTTQLQSPPVQEQENSAQSSPKVAEPQTFSTRKQETPIQTDQNSFQQEASLAKGNPGGVKVNNASPEEKTASTQNSSNATSSTKSTAEGDEQSSSEEYVSAEDNQP